MRRALVTGATGGLGLALVESLLASGGYVVRATGRDRARGARLRSLGAEFRPADIRDTESLAALTFGQEAVFHTAALSSPWGDPAVFRAINLDATRALLDAARAAGAELFVNVSTPSVYVRRADQLGITEQTPIPPPANAYAATKHAAELAVLAANSADFTTVSIRPRALVGPDDAVLLPRLLRMASRGWFPLIRGGRALLEPTDVRDAAAALVAADQHRRVAAGLAINISGGAPLTLRELAETVFGSLGLSPRLVELPYAPTAAVARILEEVCRRLPGRPEPPLTAYSVDALAFCQTFDLTRARTILQWAPRYSPEAAIARTVQAWRRDASL